MLHRLKDGAHRIVIAQLTVGRTEFWLQENRADRPGPCRERVHMTLTVDEPAARFGRAIAAGATEISPLSGHRGWRSGRLADPFGHHWEVGGPPTGRSA